jgi:hypothetical protein
LLAACQSLCTTQSPRRCPASRTRNAAAIVYRCRPGS